MESLNSECFLACSRASLILPLTRLFVRESSGARDCIIILRGLILTRLTVLPVPHFFGGYVSQFVSGVLRVKQFVHNEQTIGYQW